MRIGVPKEIKVLEHRVGLTPGSARELHVHGHELIVESCAGQGIGMEDDAYRNAGASIVATAAEVFGQAEMIVKVKEPQAAERKMLRPGQILFTYLHLAPDAAQARDLIASGAVCIAYETVTSSSGGLPLLAPMSEVAGRMAIQAGAYFLEKTHGGLGVLLGGVPGVDPAKVVILGGGVVGSHACHIALGMGADVWVLDRSTEVLRALWRQFGRPLNTVFSTHDAIEQGGCFETSHPTTHADPTYVVDGVIHYCVANMPGGVPRTSTFALNNATLPFVLALADKGWKKALADDPHLKNGLNVASGKVTCKPVADALGYEYIEPESVMH